MFLFSFIITLFSITSFQSEAQDFTVLIRLQKELKSNEQFISQNEKFDRIFSKLTRRPELHNTLVLSDVLNSTELSLGNLITKNSSIIYSLTGISLSIHILNEMKLACKLALESDNPKKEFRLSYDEIDDFLNFELRPKVQTLSILLINALPLLDQNYVSLHEIELHQLKQQLYRGKQIHYQDLRLLTELQGKGEDLFFNDSKLELLAKMLKIASLPHQSSILLLALISASSEHNSPQNLTILRGLNEFLQTAQHSKLKILAAVALATHEKISFSTVDELIFSQAPGYFYLEILAKAAIKNRFHLNQEEIKNYLTQTNTRKSYEFKKYYECNIILN